MMSKEKEDRNLRPIVLSAVKAIMKAHLEDLKKQGLLFIGPIMEVDISQSYETLKFTVSKELINFLELQIKKGSFQDGLSNKIVIILDNKKEDQNEQ